MKNLIAIVFFFCSIGSLAQTGNPSSEIKSSLASLVKAKLGKRQLPKLDKLPIAKADTLKVKIDSAKVKIAHRSDSIMQVVKAANHKLDSALHPDFTRYKNELDSAKGRLTSKIDSLGKLRLPTEKYSKVLDSLAKINPLKQVDKAQKKINQAQSDISNRINEPTKKVNEKLNLLSKESEGHGTLPANLSGAKLPQGGLANGLPSGNLNAPSVHDSNNPVGKEMNNLGKEVGKDLNVGKVDELNVGGELKNVQNATSEVTKEVGKIDTYSQDVKSISEGKTDKIKELDKDIAKTVQSKELSTAQSELDIAKQLLVSSFRIFLNITSPFASRLVSAKFQIRLMRKN